MLVYPMQCMHDHINVRVHYTIDHCIHNIIIIYISFCTQGNGLLLIKYACNSTNDLNLWPT